MTLAHSCKRFRMSFLRDRIRNALAILIAKCTLLIGSIVVPFWDYLVGS